jgi:Periplasmic copper-binding protein (NosD)
MIRRILPLLFAIAMFFGFFSLSAQAAPASQTIVVGTASATCPAQVSTIQAGVNAASPGATIRICAGTYPEQVTISKALKIRGDNAVIIEPASVTANVTGTAAAQAIAAIVLVENTTDVDIENVIVDGSSNGIGACSPELVGIFYQNASGELDHTTVRNVKLSASLDGCQSGDAILIQSGGGEMSVVTVQNSSVHDYQKNGITANETGTQVTIDHNVVTGAGPTTGAAQNGIQIGFGAAGSVRRNIVANNVYAPCTSVQSCPAVAEDILIYQSDRITVDHNKTGVAQVGIAINGNHATVSHNQVFDSMVADGIELIGSDNDARDNRIVDSDRAAIAVDGNGNTVEQNHVDEAADGVLKVSGSTGNVIANNDYFNTVVTVQDPAVPAPAAQPYR